MHMFWAVRQQAILHQAEAKATDAAADSREVRDEMRFVADAIDRVLLLNRAMWELLSERTNLTEKDLVAKVTEVDLRDGKADGRLRTDVRKCAQCGRTLQKRHLKCLYCGASETGQDPFRGV
jgi:hypothetical protein